MANQFVAFQDDRHGLGAWVAGKVAETAFPRRAPDADGDLAEARSLATGSYGLSLSGGGSGGAMPAAGRTREDPGSFGAAYKTWTSPRSSAPDTVAAVLSGQAAFGVLPLMGDQGFDADTLAALVDFPAVRPTREFVASSNFVLAVPTDLIHEAEQSGFTDSFSSGGSKSFDWSEPKRRKYRQRIGTVLASNDALRHCGPAIEGLRARGVDVQAVPDGADSAREGLRLAGSLLDPGRQVETRYSGERQERRSRTTGANANKPLVGVLLTLDRAMGEDGYEFGGDYTVLDTDMAGADPVRTAYVAVAKGARPKVKDPVRAAVAEIDAALASDPRSLPSRKTPDDRVSRADFAYGDEPPKREKTKRSKTVSGRRADGGGAELARVLWKVNTTGTSNAKSGRLSDYSPVLGMLTKANIPHKVTQLSGRPGNPVVIAFDVPRARSRSVKPILAKLASLKGSQNLGAFPATEPLVDPALLPRAEEGAGGVRAATLLIAVLGLLGLFLAWRYFTA